jgi:hypothetical protein
MKTRRLALASLLLVLPLVAGCKSTASALKDVAVTGCNADPGGGRPMAVGAVDNHTSKASTYAIDINFYDSSGNQVTEGGATLGKVEPGATATFSAEGLNDAKGPLTCKIGSVTRTIAP